MWGQTRSERDSERESLRVFIGCYMEHAWGLRPGALCGIRDGRNIGFLRRIGGYGHRKGYMCRYYQNMRSNLSIAMEEGTSWGRHVSDPAWRCACWHR